MRYGLPALSLAMLTSGGLAAQSAYAITLDTTTAVAQAPTTSRAETSAEYGSLPFASDQPQRLRIALR